MQQATTARPASIETLAEYLGDGAAARICMALGGTQLKVPRGQYGKTWLLMVELLGQDAAIEMIECFGGESIYIARNAAEERAARAALVQSMLARGMTFAEVSRQLTFTARYTERGLRKLMAATYALHAQPVNTAQASLGFDTAAAALTVASAHPLHSAWGHVVACPVEAVPPDASDQ